MHDRGVRVRDAPDARHPPAARPRPRPRAGQGRRSVNDWAGGTRIGESFREFNQKWARRSLRTTGVVIVVSDGWDRGDPGARRPGDGAPPAELPSADLAQPARRHARLPAARRRDAGRLPVHRRLPAGRHGREPRAPRRDPRAASGPGDTPPGERGGRATRRVASGRREPVAAPPLGARSPGASSAASAVDPARAEATAMKELLDTLTPGRRRAAPARARGRRPDVRVGAAAGGRRAARRGRRPAGGLGQRRLRRGRGVRGDRARPRDRPRPRHPLRDQRRAGVGRRPRLRRHDRRAGRAGRAGRCVDRRGSRVGRAGGQARPSSRRSRPTRRRPSSGRTSRATARRPSAAGRRRRRAADRLARRRRQLDAALVDAATAALGAACRGRSSSAAGRSSSRPSRSGRGSSIVGAVQVALSLVAVARELGYETVVVDGRAAFATRERFPDADRLIVGWPDEVAERDRPRAERCGRGAVARRQVRRAGDRRGAAPRLPLRRRGRVAQDPGRSARAAARGRRHRGGAGAAARARSGSTSAVGRPPRRRSRSWPRSSPRATAAPAPRCASGRSRLPEASGRRAGRSASDLCVGGGGSIRSCERKDQRLTRRSPQSCSRPASGRGSVAGSSWQRSAAGRSSSMCSTRSRAPA